MDWTVARIVDRLEALASNARERQGSHPDDSTAWHYEHGVGDAYAFAARMVSEFAQGGTVAQPPEVVPFSSPDQNRMNAAQADYPLEAFKKEFHASLAAGEPTGRAVIRGIFAVNQASYETLAALFADQALLDEGGNAPRTGEVAKNRLEVLFGPGAGASRPNETTLPIYEGRLDMPTYLESVLQEVDDLLRRAKPEAKGPLVSQALEICRLLHYLVGRGVLRRDAKNV